MPKENYNRKFPNANHQPCQKAADRKMKAEVRQSVYDELTLEQKIAALPPEPYSKKQRARLMALLEKKNQPKQETPAVVDGSHKTVKYMKGVK